MPISLDYRTHAKPRAGYAKWLKETDDMNKAVAKDLGLSKR